MEIFEVKGIIEVAFSNVVLGDGVSLIQAKETDRLGNGVKDLTVIDYNLEGVAVNDDWLQLSCKALDCYPYIAYLDAKGFRYYIPAFMTSVLDYHQPQSMRVIATLSSLHPKKQLWEYFQNLYSLLDQQQCTAIALFLTYLTTLDALDLEDRIIVARSLKGYWHNWSKPLV